MKEKDAIIYTHTKDPKLTELERKAAEEKDPEKRRELFTEIMMNMENGDPKPNLSAGNEYILFLHQKKQAGHYRVFYSHSVIRATEKRLKAMEQATNPELWSWGPEINGLQLGAYIEEPHCAYQDRFEKGKFIIEGIVLGVRNTSDKTINLCDGPARVTVSVNGKQFVQPDDEALKLKSKDRPWTLEPGALQPLAENNHHHRDSRYPCWFELPMVDDLKDYEELNKELILTFTFTPQKDESGDTWQGKLSSGPLVVTEEEDDPVNHERGQSPLAD